MSVAQVLQFPLASGVHEDVDPRTAKPGLLQRLSNCVWTKDGLLGKRQGLSALPTTGGPASGVRLMGRGAELIATDGTALYSYSPTTGAWVNTGSIPEVGLTWSTLISPEEGMFSDAIGVLSTGEVVHAWCAVGTVYASGVGRGVVYWEKLDPATGARTSGTAAVLNSAAEAHFRLLVSGAHFIILQKTGASIKYSYDGGVPANLRTDASTSNPDSNGALDAVVVGSNIFFVYENNAGGATNITIAKATFANPPVVSATANITGSTGSAFLLGIDGRSGEDVWVTWAEGDVNKTQYLWACDASLSQQLAKTTVFAPYTANHYPLSVAVTRASSTTVIVQGAAASGSNGPGDVAEGVTKTCVVNTSGTVSAIRTSLGTMALSKPFALGSSFYTFLCDAVESVAMLPDDPSVVPFVGNSSYLVAVDTVDVTYEIPHRLVAAVSVTDAGAWSQFNVYLDSTRIGAFRGYLPSAIVSPDATEMWCPLPRVLEAPRSQDFGFRQGALFVRVQATAYVTGDTWRATTLENELVLGAAALFSYDGNKPFPYGFTRGPTVASMVGAGAGGTMVDGTYGYCGVTEYESRSGLLYRSPPAAIRSIAVSSAGANTCETTNTYTPQTIHCKDRTAVNTLAGKPDKCFTAVYRTEKDLATLHRVPTAFNGPKVEWTAQMSTIIDARADADIPDTGAGLDAQPTIYTDAEYEDYAPPAALAIVRHQDRLFVLAGDKRTVWYSKNYLESPGIAPGFHPSQILQFEDDLVGLASMDDKLVLFSETAIWYTQGAGPAVNGDGSDYAPTKVQTDLGCANARSLVSSQDGIIFQSARGIVLLKRNLEVDLTFGRPVQVTVAAYPNITSATTVHAKSHVRFTCNAADGLSGRTLSYDLVRGQWSVFSYSLNGTSGAPIADAVVVDDVWYCLTSNGHVFFEDDASWIDPGDAWVTADFETTEISGDGPLSYQRIRRAYLSGTRYTDTDVTVRIAVNESAAYDQTRTWLSDAVSNVGSADLGVHVKTQKASSIRMRISDATPTGAGAVVGTGRGVDFSALGFEVVPKQGMEKRPATARK